MPGPVDFPNDKLRKEMGIVDKFSFHERCLQEGICPSGCGPLTTKNSKERFCKVCRFRHWNATPDRTPHSTL